MSDAPRRVGLTPTEELFVGHAPKLMGVRTSLEPRFDPFAGLQYMGRYRALEMPFDVPQGAPSREWISSRLASFVRGEFGGTSASAPRPAPPRPQFNEPEIADTRQLMWDYLYSCESAVFNGLAGAIARQSGDSVAEKLYAVLTHDLLGNPVNARNVPLESFTASVGPRVDAQERLLFVFPGFPFKDQNPFRTLGPATAPDLAEVALMVRLHTLSTAIYQVYHMGADWVVMTDGTAFSEALRVSIDDCLRYQSNLVRIRNELDLGQAVSIVNLLDLCGLVDSPPGLWDTVEEEVRRTLSSGELGGEAVESLVTLARGMKRNVNLRDMQGDIPWEAWWAITTYDRDSCPNEWRKTWDEVDFVARSSAIKYAAFNVTLRWFDVERKVFPEAIRATIHAKPGQLAVPRIGSEFPWNGLAVSGTGSDVSISTLGCFPLRELATRGRITQHLSDSGAPFMCTISAS